MENLTEPEMELNASKVDDNLGTVRGRGLRYNAPGNKFGWTQFFDPGSMKRSIDQKSKSSKRDIKLLRQHDPGQPLARQRGGSLRLEDTEKGLLFEADLNLASYRIHDAYEDVRSGILDEASVGVRVIKETWDDSDQNNVRRYIHEAELIELSLVTEGAFQSSSVRAAAYAEMVDGIQSYAAHCGVDPPDLSADVDLNAGASLIAAIQAANDKSVASSAERATVDSDGSTDLAAGTSDEPVDSSPPPAPVVTIQDISGDIAKMQDRWRCIENAHLA